MDKEIVFNGYNFVDVSNFLGNIPGKTVEKEYIRRTYGNSKIIFYDQRTKKWLRVKPGSTFQLTDEGPVML